MGFHNESHINPSMDSRRNRARRRDKYGFSRRTIDSQIRKLSDINQNSSTNFRISAPKAETDQQHNITDKNNFHSHDQYSVDVCTIRSSIHFNEASHCINSQIGIICMKTLILSLFICFSSIFVFYLIFLGSAIINKINRTKNFFFLLAHFLFTSYLNSQ